MINILITGSTGNVGKKVIKYLCSKNGDFQLLAGVRKVEDESSFLHLPKVKLIHFDFEDQLSIATAFEQTDILFLLRPPQLADVKKYFDPLMSLAKDNNIQHIVFLSVQGADSNSLIPHYKIEKLIIESGINYTFLRPAYFMQNFTTTLRKDIVDKNIIYLPAGRAKFTIVDIEDIALTAAEILVDVKTHTNKAYDLTNDEKLNFQQMAAILSERLGREINYKSPSLFLFYLKKRKEKVPAMFILVMIMLHYLPRFKPVPQTTGWVKDITGKKPGTFKAFAEAHKSELKGSN
jgi:uncharacterized protein YbjT (DUF2867 family)